MQIPKTCRVFIDCEFTDFINRDLISIGAVCSNGAEFYGENTQYVKAWASDWVKEHVVPFCYGPSYSRSELSARLWCWIDDLPADFVIITVDYDGDYELLYDLFGEEKHPKMIEWQHINKLICYECDRQIISKLGNDLDYHNMRDKVTADFHLEFMQYFLDTKEIQHHALSDAKANHRAWNHVVNKYGMSI